MFTSVPSSFFNVNVGTPEFPVIVTVCGVISSVAAATSSAVASSFVRTSRTSALTSSVKVSLFSA